MASTIADRSEQAAMDRARRAWRRELRNEFHDNGGLSPQLKKYVPSMASPPCLCNLENPETLVVSSTYDGAFTCVLGTYILEQGVSPCGRPIYKKPEQPLFILYAGSIQSWVFAESSNARRWCVLWRVRSDAKTPLDIRETWEAVRPNFYDSDGCPVVNRQQEDGKGWDKVQDIEFSSSLFPQLPDACPCDETACGVASREAVAVAVATNEECVSSDSE